MFDECSLQVYAARCSQLIKKKMVEMSQERGLSFLESHVATLFGSIIYPK